VELNTHVSGAFFKNGPKFFLVEPSLVLLSELLCFVEMLTFQHNIKAMWEEFSGELQIK
jgi:hypothetical protein